MTTYPAQQAGVLFRRSSSPVGFSNLCDSGSWLQTTSSSPPLWLRLRCIVGQPFPTADPPNSAALNPPGLAVSCVCSQSETRSPSASNRSSTPHLPSLTLPNRSPG